MTIKTQPKTAFGKTLHYVPIIAVQTEIVLRFEQSHTMQMSRT